MAQNKTLTNLQLILDKHNVEPDSPLYIDLVGILSKAKAKTAEQELYLYDDDNNVTHKYCLWHKKYEPVADFAKSTRSKDGLHYECKLAGKHWALYSKQIKEQEQNITMAKDGVLDGVYSIARGKEVIEEHKLVLDALIKARADKVDNEAYQAEDEEEEA